MKVTRPTSIRRVRPERRTVAALRACEGIPSVLLKSPPVPLGKIPSSTSLPEIRMPLATSEMVPSPPQAMISFAPLRAASAANETPKPGPSVKTILKAPKYVRKSDAIFGQALRVAPPADSGLTMIRGRDIEIFDLRFSICDLCLGFCALCFAEPNQGRGLKQSTKHKAQSSKTLIAYSCQPFDCDRFLLIQQSYSSQCPLSLCVFVTDRVSVAAPTNQATHRNGSESLLRHSNCAQLVEANYCTSRQ